MSKFCENCGAEMADDQVICPSCGNGAQAEKEAQPIVENVESNPTSSKKSELIKKVGIIGGLVAVVVIIIAILASLIGSGWKKPIKNYIKALNKCDGDLYEEVYPDFMKTKKSDSDLKDDKKEDEKDYGDNVKYSVKILKKTKISKDELKDVEEYVEKKYDTSTEIKKGYKVKVETKVKGKEDYDYSTSTIYVYKVDGKWKRIPVSPETAKKSKDSKSSDDYSDYLDYYNSLTK